MFPPAYNPLSVPIFKDVTGLATQLATDGFKRAEAHGSRLSRLQD